MDERIRQLLTPEILNSVNGMELVARIIVEGFMSGANKSQTIGSGQEFSQYRNYESGDDLRQLDWRMYARSGRYFIKQSEVETNITVKFMLDASNSMAYREGGISKIMYARVIAASLAFLARKQGDSFGLFIINAQRISVILPRFEQQQFMRFLLALVNAPPESTWNNDSTEQLFDHHGKEMVIFITDLYDDQKDLLKFIYRLKTKRNEVMVFHILGRNEMDLDFGGSFTFMDLEKDSTIKVDTRSERKMYTERVQAWIQESRTNLLEKDIHYYPVSMADEVHEVLRNFLSLRKSFRA